MALNRRSFLMLASSQDASVYAGPGKREMSQVGFAEDISGEKKIAPVPVGARSVKRYLSKCVGCMKCVSVCPQGVLRNVARRRQFGRPVLDFRYGWCRPECNLCAEACPSGAILPKPVDAASRRVTSKADNPSAGSGETPRLQTNLAVWHHERCVAATGKDACHACERHCPVKAITLIEPASRAGGADGSRSGQKRYAVPRVNPAKCIGCGKCEHYCPARPKAAMTVEGRA